MQIQHQCISGGGDIPWFGQCRICSRNDTPSVNIYSYEGEKLGLQTKLETCLRIYVTKWDTLPTSVCEFCISRLSCCYDLMSECMRGQKNFLTQQQRTYKQQIKSEPLFQETAQPSNRGVVEDWNKPELCRLNMADKNMSVDTYAENSECSKSTKTEIEVEERILYCNDEKNVNTFTVKCIRSPVPEQINDPTTVETIRYASNDPTTILETHTFDEKCRCADCDLIKYGSLPLLAEAIEQRERCVGTVSDPGGSYTKYYETEPFKGQCGMDTPSGDTFHNQLGYLMTDTHTYYNEYSNVFVDNSCYLQPGPSQSDNMNYKYILPKPKPEPLCEVLVKTEVENELFRATCTENTSLSESIHSAKKTKPKTNTNSKIIKCEFCLKEFGHKGDLNKHKRSHTGEKPFVCETCGRTFAHTSNLLRHTRTHTRERPFRCGACGKNFGRKDKMISHAKSRLCKSRAEGSRVKTPNV